MNSRRCALLIAFAAFFALTSCSGVKNGFRGGGGGSGNATLNLTLAAVPLTPPPGTSILSFAVSITSVSLTPSTDGSDVVIPLNSSSYSVDLMRLQSDSAFLGQLKAGVPSGTYNHLSVNLDAVVTYCAANSGTQGCNTGSVAQFTKSFATPTTSNFTLTLAASQQAGLRVQINFANALTVNSSTQAVTGVNLTAANVVTTLSLPPATSTLSSGQLDYIEDVTGVVTAASSSSVTVQTATRGAITSAVTSTTLASPNCVIQNQPCTATVGQIASFDATLNSDGTSTMLQYDPLSNTSLDVIEGIVTTLNTFTTQLQIVANDFVAATSGSNISGLNLGDPVNVTLTATVKPFLVDTKGLPTFGTFSGSTSATSILPGQTVALHITSFTAKSGTTPASAQADIVVLRFTRVAGSVTNPTGAIFSLQSLPPFFGATGSLQVQTSAGTPITYLDGYTSTGNISTGDNVGVRALFFGSGTAPSFTAAKVRKN
jgi:hypothetical protein